VSLQEPAELTEGVENESREVRSLARSLAREGVNETTSCDEESRENLKRIQPEKTARQKCPYNKPTQVGEGEYLEARKNYCKGTRPNDSVTSG